MPALSSDCGDWSRRRASCDGAGGEGAGLITDDEPPIKAEGVGVMGDLQSRPRLPSAKALQILDKIASHGRVCPPLPASLSLSSSSSAHARMYALLRPSVCVWNGLFAMCSTFLGLQMWMDRTELHLHVSYPLEKEADH